MQTLCLLGILDVRQPMLMSDWTHLLPDLPAAKQLHARLMEDLKEIADNIDQMNSRAPSKDRPKICQTFNPKFLECSISL